MRKGFVAIKREIEELYEKLPRKKKATGRAFLDYLFMNCNHTDAEVEIDGVGKRTIRRGQIWTGRRTLAEVLGIGETVIRTLWKYFEKRGCIATIESTRHGSLISLLIYDEYVAKKEDIGDINQQTDQQTNQQLTSKQPTISQQLTTNNNDNNVDNDNNVKKNGIYILEPKKILIELENRDTEVANLIEKFVNLNDGRATELTSKQKLALVNSLVEIYDTMEFTLNSEKFDLERILFIEGLNDMIMRGIPDLNYLKKFWYTILRRVEGDL